ncbi:MAG: hydantoinase B/oxoprolinase family protein [cyanobacterium endosymbiont of Rhopalodia yunnanensis]
MLNPNYPSGVIAENIETSHSQSIIDVLSGALKVLAASQGTMNSFIVDNEKYQYYEKICGGSRADYNFDGTDTVHTHMTNSCLIAPKVLE